MKTAKKEPQTKLADYKARQYTWFTDITEQGGLGDPTNSDAEFIEQVITDATQRILDALESDSTQ